MTNQLITNIKVQYNILKYKLAKILHIATSPMSKYIIVEHRDASGKLLYKNAAALIDQGEENILKGWFQGISTNLPTNFKVNLATDATILETATTYTVVTGTGYAEVAVAHNNTDWVASHPSNPWIVTSKNCVFTAGGTWTGAVKVVLSATLNASDLLIAYADLVATRYLFNGDTLTVSLVMSLE